MVARLRGLTGIRKIGHAGTLDPFADGLLAVCIGRATRMIRYLEQHDKVYRVTVAFGRSTDTYDLTGKTCRTHQLTETEKKQLLTSDFAVVRRAVRALTLMREQEPPMYSAVKVEGRPLYAYARQGQTIERQARPVRIDKAILETISLDSHVTLDMTIHCSKGTYIRSLCEYLGQMTGWGAHATALRRVASGPWHVGQAVTLTQLAAWMDGRTREEALRIFAEKGVLLPAFAALEGLARLTIETAAAHDLVCGRPVYLPGERSDRSQRVAIWCGEQLVAVAQLERHSEDTWRIRTERVLINSADLLRT